ncbi:DUF2935 domain-containing protein [Thermoactinomyces intermedius]|uniref:DUF2935 domain-containing protein n=1 Tax=Thermoactinomyces intermedius TaxID=2024 RepID=A0A8I1DE63_THEIN|nr:DUF2935 domain-containing protein [Thermoactinomyces intermedius]MBH8583814.1 DUF2935 domain-containing protein [Thermoactinomyces sp. CICC 10735]MBH8585211.1 DUF2935 domain-containing protein [Thermoactinomyces sp. CICC 10520]MBH8602110.1 DUF2935 domain-containing protein [Thermoactinomyces sp. CICC 23799]MBI0385975.1 DUF2935 domain-containing protein [Thermoactinomyces sp. CICC 24227]MBI0390757.1 DUF2935 domain-containing protein [Thermoactinomyces sp. CICC 24226]
MQFYYGEKMPLRILDEAEFWKQQEAEHTVVIKELVKNLESRYVEALNEWEKALTDTHQLVVRWIETKIRLPCKKNPELEYRVKHLVRFCLHQSEQFIKLCRMIRDQSAAFQGNRTAQVVMNHIIRESEYFIGIAQTILWRC